MNVKSAATMKQKNNNAKLNDRPLDKKTDKLPKKMLKKIVIAMPIIVQIRALDTYSGSCLATRAREVASSMA